MIIYPTIELHNGKAVSLRRGRLKEPHVWHIDPIETVHGFAEAGAEWMHLTDINALAGDGNNNTLSERIVREAGIPVQFGGGFRSRDMVEQWIEKGVGRVVIGTMAAYDPALLKEIVKRHPDQIVLAVDIYEGSVMTEGWRKKSALDPDIYIKAFEECPLAGILVTDIDSDIKDGEASIGLISHLASLTRHQVIARGTVHTVDDVSRLKYVHNISGTLIGRALMSRNVDLKEALSVARAEPDPVAPFI